MLDKNIDKDIEEFKHELINSIGYIQEGTGCSEGFCYTCFGEGDLEQTLKIIEELETYKKIAEKLAGYGFNCYYGSPLKFDSPEELIEIARKETEDEELARKEVLKDE